MRALRITITSVLLGASCFSAAAQGYPERPVRLVVPYPVGGPADIFARVVAQSLSSAWRGSVVVENRPGGNGIPAAQYASRAAADGYTILMTDPATMAMNLALYSKLPYDAEKDFVPVINMFQFSCVLFANAGVPANSFPELVALAKAKPDTITYASFGMGSFTHLHQEELNARAGIRLHHIPYKGAGDVVPALMGGHVQLALTGYIAAAPGLRDGKLKALAIASPKRLPQLPDVPTFAELGIPFTCASWIGLGVPAGTPKPIVDKIAADVGKAISAPEFQQKYISGLGFELLNVPGERFAEFLKKERESYSAYVKRVNVKLD
ncbi:MAG TPA: tripartite tricarboxylate transporter substrate binding protein [Ramlibacter sp.]|nr:tripartite tricarboxylate transporter substrate binding protein [Ramlibacter sp.]